MAEELNNGNWVEWSRYVLEKLRELTSEVKALRDQIADLTQEVTALKTQAAFYGAASGLIVGAITTILLRTVFK